jgi:peptidoglycan hydrolase-like protein with peptidoglycan-binding domain
MALLRMLLFALTCCLVAGGSPIRAEEKPSPFPQKRPRVKFSDLVKRVQETLRAENYYRGSVDGILGPQTRAALEQYQKDRNLDAVGRLNWETIDSLGLSPLPRRAPDPPARTAGTRR